VKIVLSVMCFKLFVNTFCFFAKKYKVLLKSVAK